ncbi:MAG: hypothetical protein ACRERE_37805 [Candidatus Entotheonellia bacterium]
MSVCRTRAAAQRTREAVTQVVPTRQRTRHPTKPRIGEMRHAGVAVLGCHFTKVRARQSGRWVPLMGPGQRALNAVRRQMRSATRRRRLRGSVVALVAKRHPIIRGWRHDCRGGNSTQPLQVLAR